MSIQMTHLVSDVPPEGRDSARAAVLEQHGGDDGFLCVSQLVEP